MLVYNLAFQYGQVGQAATLGIVLTAFIYIAVLAVNIVSREKD